MWEIWANLLLPKALKVAQSPINRQIWSHCLQQTSGIQQGDRNFPISALMQPTAENADCCVNQHLADSEAALVQIFFL